MHISDLLIFAWRWLCLIRISPEKFEFYEYKIYLDVEIVAPSTLLHNSNIIFSKYCVRYHFLITALFHTFNFIYIWWITDISPLSQFALMIVQKANEKINKDEIEKKRNRNLIFLFQTTKSDS